MKAEFSENGLIHIYPDNNAEVLALKNFWNYGLRLNGSHHRDGKFLSLSIIALKDNQKMVIQEKEVHKPIKGRMIPLPAVLCDDCKSYCYYHTEDFGTDKFDACIYCPNCKEEKVRNEAVRKAVLEQHGFIHKTIKAVNELTTIALENDNQPT